MTPLAAIQAGTLNGAKLLGWEGQIGALKAGYLRRRDRGCRAIRLKISARLEKVTFVMKGGVTYRK